MKNLIIGGTGTLGTAVIRNLLKKNRRADITVFSRDELKQKKLKELYPSIKCVIGDIKDLDSLTMVCRDAESVFHFAALKHIDVAEENPEECIKTNVMGTMNVAKACIDNNVTYCVFSSTDKAVLPINTYGMCKAVSEKYLFEQNKIQNTTAFSVFRWGNVLGSRGSVIHSFKDTLLNKKMVYVTDPKMTRFWIHIDDAANYILHNYDDAPKDYAMIPAMKATTIMKLAELTAKHLNIKDYKVEITGIRRGEKIHECLRSEHDHCIRSDTIEPYSDDELMEMIEKTI